jgi:hypothetical protein
MKTSVIRSREYLYEFLNAVGEQLGAPDATVCQLFVPFVGSRAGVLTDLECAWDARGNALLLDLDESADPLLLPASAAGAEMEDGQLVRFGLTRVSDGVWAVEPSLHIPGVLHAFVVLYDVPKPAPWEQLIVLVKA